MILHLALFTWNDDIDDSDVSALTEALRAMAAELDVLRTYDCGPALHVRPGADYGVAATLDHAVDLEAYLDSPGHRQVYTDHLSRMVRTRQTVQIALSTP